MRKTIVILIVILLIGALFLGGCTETDPDDSGSTINSAAEADETIDNASLDISGINNSLDDIDNLLTEP